jgi:hypothetical protein
VASQEGLSSVSKYGSYGRRLSGHKFYCKYPTTKKDGMEDFFINCLYGIRFPHFGGVFFGGGDMLSIQLSSAVHETHIMA